MTNKAEVQGLFLKSAFQLMVLHGVCVDINRYHLYNLQVCSMSTVCNLDKTSRNQKRHMRMGWTPGYTSAVNLKS